jgi:hypothetical protein
MNARVQTGRVEARAIRNDEVLPGVGKAKAFFVLGAGISFLLSVSLFFTGNREQGIFVGIWVPSILSAGALLLGRNGHE